MHLLGLEKVGSVEMLTSGMEARAIIIFFPEKKYPKFVLYIYGLVRGNKDATITPLFVNIVHTLKRMNAECVYGIRVEFVSGVQQPHATYLVARVFNTLGPNELFFKPKKAILIGRNYGVTARWWFRNLRTHAPSTECGICRNALLCCWALFCHDLINYLTGRPTRL